MMKYFFSIMLILFVWLFFWGKIYIHIKYQKNKLVDKFLLQVFLGKFCLIYKFKSENIIDTFLHKLLCRLSPNSQACSTAAIKQRQNVDKRAPSRLDKLKKLQLLTFNLLQPGISQLNCNVRLALGDAAQTAILFGSLQAVQGVVMQWLNSYVVLKESPEIAIVPDFNSSEKEVLLDCIVSVKIGNIIHMLKFYAIMHWREKHG